MSQPGSGGGPESGQCQRAQAAQGRDGSARSTGQASCEAGPGPMSEQQRARERRRRLRAGPTSGAEPQPFSMGDVLKMPTAT